MNMVGNLKEANNTAIKQQCFHILINPPPQYSIKNKFKNSKRHTTFTRGSNHTNRYLYNREIGVCSDLTDRCQEELKELWG